MNKLLYNGQPVELITLGYWPDGIDLICSDDGSVWHDKRAICLHDGIIFDEDCDTSVMYKYWAIKPAKHAARRLTNREVFELCKKGWDVLSVGKVQNYWPHRLIDENEPTLLNLEKLRAPGSDEWVEPTSDLLEDV